MQTTPRSAPGATTTPPPTAPPPTARRLPALDAARGLAVIGMYVQHFASSSGAGRFVAGNTTLLFVLCGGVAFSVMAAGSRRRAVPVGTFRARVLARSVFIDVLGYGLILLNVGYGVILPAYAVLFVAALFLVHRSTRALVGALVLTLLLAPPVMVWGGSLLTGSALLADTAGGPLSALALAPSFLAGVLIGRADLTRARTAWTLAGAGTLALAVLVPFNRFLLPRLSTAWEDWLVAHTTPGAPDVDQYAVWPSNTSSPLWNSLTWSAPHSASTFQTVTGLALACLVLGSFCLVPARAGRLLAPLAATGRVPLTLYCLQFVVLWVLARAGTGADLSAVPAGDLLLAVAVLVLGVVLAGRGQGPLEALMRRADRSVTAALQPVPAGGAPTAP